MITRVIPNKEAVMFKGYMQWDRKEVTGAPAEHLEAEEVINGRQTDHCSRAH